jgi:hypothetical protein
VPIPLTYDQLTWDYQAWTGFKLFADWHLRAQSDLFAVITSLIPFFTNRDTKLHDPPDKTDFKLDLTIGPNYLALPQYLGGAVLGPQDALPKMDLAYGVKCFLDAMKFGNAGYLIEAVPLRHPQTKAWIRIGVQKAGVSFGPLKFEAGVGWCITTEAEFKREIVLDQDAQKILGQLNAAAILDNLPDRSGPAYEKGFIVLLMGHGGLAGVLDYRADFGIAVTSAGGFETKLRMQARLAGLLVLNLYGLIKVTEQGRTMLEGGCSLKFRDLEIIGSTQQITVTDTSFELVAELRLAGACTLSGDFYIGRDQVYLKGKFSWKYAPGNPPESAVGVFARFDNTGLEIGVGTANLFGVKCAELSIYVNVTRSDPIGARAKLDDLSQLNQKLGLSIQNYKAEIDQAVDDAKQLVDQTMADLNEKIGGFEDLRKRLPGYLNGLRIKKIPDMINARVKGVYETLEWWQKLAVSEETIRKEAQAYYHKNFAGLIRSLEERLKAVKDGEEAATAAQTRELLQQALTAIINIKDISYTYEKTVPIHGTFRKPVTIPDPIKPYRNELQNLRTLLCNLPDQWGKNASAQAAYAAKSRIKQGIDGVVANITRQIPQIESVQLDLPVAFKTPVVDAYVKMQYADKSYSLKPVHLDLGNPAGSIDSITEAFAYLLCGNDG